MFANIDLFFQFYFQKNRKKATLQKKMTVEEELDCIDIDNIGNLEDSPRLVFIDKRGMRESHSSQQRWRTYQKY